MATTFVPPIKSQGIKTKLVPWIRSLVPDDFRGRWVEPFMGTGVVALNIAPKNALLCDTNPHIVEFYDALRSGVITSGIVREYLEHEGELLRRYGSDHYYFVRSRFNDEHRPLDFLFLNRSGFNGMIRFNRKGGFNIPFCKKPNRFAPSYVTKIVNQVAVASKIISVKGFEFKCQGFSQTISEAREDDIIYCDPPYIGRHADYFNTWDDACENELLQSLQLASAPFILSTWHHNDFRSNKYIDSHWGHFGVLTRDHFYHVGASQGNRNPMVEALITSINHTYPKTDQEPLAKQLQLLEPRTRYNLA